MSAANARGAAAVAARAGRGAPSRSARSSVPGSPFPPGTAPTPGVADERSDWRLISLDQRKREVVVESVIEDARAHGPRGGADLTPEKVTAFFDSACRDLARDPVALADVTDDEAFYLRDFARRVRLDLPAYPVDEARSPHAPALSWATSMVIAGIVTVLAVANFVFIPYGLAIAFGWKLTPDATGFGEAVGIFSVIGLLDLSVAALIKWRGRG